MVALSANQGDVRGAGKSGLLYDRVTGVIQDYVQAYCGTA